MDDMKKLVEKYKRELMEYSKAAAPGKLDFPEMLPDAPEQPPRPEPVTQVPAEPQKSPAEQPAPQEPKRPTIIGWSANDDIRDFGRYFDDITSQKNSPPAADDDFTTLPPQFTDEPPQLDQSNENVSPEHNSITDENEAEQPSEFRRDGENTTADPEQFDSIGTIPESGQSPDEQLGRRSFESRQSAVNSPEDVKPLVQQENDNFPQAPMEPECADMDEFLRLNPMQGSVRFRTYTARNALPVPGARVVLFKTIGGSRHIFYDVVTDISGLTATLALPAPPSHLSQSPNAKMQPYALYDADITAKGYIPVSVRSLPVFEGIISVQRAALVPSMGTDETTNITETEPYLTEVSDA